MKKFLEILVLGLLWCNVGFANLEAEYFGDDVWVVKTDDGCVYKGKLKGVGKKKGLIFKSYQEWSRHSYGRQVCSDGNKYVRAFKDNKFNVHKYNFKLNHETG